MSKYAKSERGGGGMKPGSQQYALWLVWFLSAARGAKTSKIRTEEKRHKLQATYFALCPVKFWALLASKQAHSVMP
jgi:hypothetical protein